MNTLLAALITALAMAPTGAAAADCPAIVQEANAKVTAAEASLRGRPRSAASAKGQDVQAPRGQDVQAPRGQDVQAPRGQDVQAPRGQDVQAPRGQDVQAPRGQDVQAPRGQDVQAPRVREARTLVRQAEQACKVGDVKLAERKAKEALSRLP